MRRTGSSVHGSSAKTARGRSINKHQRDLISAPRSLALAVSSALLLSGAMAGEMRAQAFPAVIELGNLDGTDGFKLDGEAAGDQSGLAVSNAGDINGDGIDDLIIGAWVADPNGSRSGSSYAVFGSKNGFPATLQLSSLDGTNGFRMDGEAAYDYSGNDVSNAGDINGDGIDDLIIGAFGGDPNDDRSGSSYVVFGKREPFVDTLQLSGLDGTNGFKLDGEAIRDYSGMSVSNAGDINGDGIDDLAIGAFLANSSAIESGRSYVVFGSSKGFSSTLQLSSLDGTNGFKLDGELKGDKAGQSVSNAGDINGDGIDDLVVGARWANITGENSGRSYVVFGSRDGFSPTLQLSSLDGINGFKLDGEAARDYAGFPVSYAGDINGDGIDDLLIGAFGADPNGSRSGSSYAVFGSKNGFPATLQLSSLDGINGFRMDGEAASDNSGFSVSNAGDINGDGIDDLVIGAWLADANGNRSGRSYLVFGTREPFVATLQLSSLDGTDGFKLDGEARDQSGTSVSNAGDINGDGIDDLLIGAKSADPNGSASGRTYVVFGGVTGPGEIPDLNLPPGGLNFSDLMIGSIATETLVIENSGTGLLELGALSIDGTHAGDFSIEMNSCVGIQLAQGEFCGIDVGFSPTAPGVREATLRAESNALSSPDSASLRGSNDVVFAGGFE